MAIHIGNPPSGPSPAGPYSQTVRLDLGTVTLIQSSGQVAIGDDGRLIGRDDMAAQTDQVFRNIAALLTDHGATLGDLIGIRTYLTDMARLGDYGRVRLEHLDGHEPTSTTVEVSQLFLDGALLEVEVVAAVTGTPR